MTVATREQEEIFRKLVLLAGGDRDLVWKTIRLYAGPDGMAPLESVVREIKKQVEAKVQHVREHSGDRCAAI